MAGNELIEALAVHARERTSQSFSQVAQALAGAELLVPHAPQADGSPPAGRPTTFKAATVRDADGNPGQPAFADEAALLRWRGHPWPAFAITAPTLFDVSDGGGNAVELHPGSPEALWIPHDLVRQLADLFHQAAPEVLELDPAAEVHPAPWTTQALEEGLRWHLAQRPEVYAAALFDASHAGTRWPVCGMLFHDWVPAAICHDAIMAMHRRVTAWVGDAAQPWFVALQPPLLATVQQQVTPFYLASAGPPQPTGPPPEPATVSSPGLEQAARLQELVDLGLLSPHEAMLRRSQQ